MALPDYREIRIVGCACCWVPNAYLRITRWSPWHFQNSERLLIASGVIHTEHFVVGKAVKRRCLAYGGDGK
jgi:hypothetical protein